MDTEPETQYADVVTNRRAGLTGEDAYRHPDRIREERLLVDAKGGSRPPIAGAWDEVLRETEILENLVASLVDRLSPVLDLTPHPTGGEVAAEIASGVELADAIARHARDLDEISDRVRYALDRLAL